MYMTVTQSEQIIVNHLLYKHTDPGALCDTHDW